MARLNDLPDELLGIILTLLIPPPSHSCLPRCISGSKPSVSPKRYTFGSDDLIRLGAVSPRFWRLVAPALYGSITIDRRTWRLRALLRTVAANERLAGLIVSLQLGSWAPWEANADEVGAEWDHHEGEREPLARPYTVAEDATDLRLFRRTVRRLAPPNKHEWRRALRSRKPNVDEVHVSLLLLLLPHLQRLHLRLPAFPVFLIGSLEHVATVDRASLFPCLREIHLSGFNVCSPTDAQILQPLLAAPALERIHVSDMAETERTDLRPSHPLIPVTTLHLRSTRLGPQLLAQLLRSFHALRSFHYGEMVFADHRDDRLLPDALTEALEPLRPTLEHLSIDYCSPVVHSGSDMIGPLRRFPRLRHLDISFDRLVGRHPSPASPRLSHVLPEGIERLELRDMGSGNWAAQQRDILELAHLKRAEPDRFSRLRSVSVPHGTLVIDYRNEKNPIFLDQLNSLRTVCAEADFIIPLCSCLA